MRSALRVRFLKVRNLINKKITYWNIQGVKNPQALGELIALIKKTSPNILIIVETLTNRENAERIIKKTGFEKWVFTNPDNHQGGMWFLWKETIKVDILEMNNRNIIALVEERDKGSVFAISGVYGPTKENEKTEFWKKLDKWNNIIKAPCMIISDLNEIYSYGDKKGGNKVTFGRIKRLNEFCMRNKFENIPTSGNQFTWKKMEKNGMIFEKFDRCIARRNWNQMFPDSFCKVGTFTCSDHIYVELNTENIEKRNSHSFRFNQQWTKIGKIREIVRKGWAMSCRGSRMYRVTMKLRKIKWALKEWNKKENVWSMKNLDRNQGKLKRAKKKLVEEPDNEIRIKHYERLLKQREKILLFNQNYWGKWQGRNGSPKVTEIRVTSIGNYP